MVRQVAVNDPSKPAQIDQIENTKDVGLVEWVNNHVKSWEEDRDRKFEKRWRAYWRLWRGFWSSEDRNRKSERSRLISPATQQAVDSAVSEIEESLFGKGRWYDLTDKLTKPEDEGGLSKEVIKAYRIKLLDKFNKAGIPTEISKTLLLGAIFGTGIFKLNPEDITKKAIVAGVSGAAVEDKTEFLVGGEAVPPYHFATDPSAKGIGEGLGEAHLLIKPRHSIQKKIDDGIYRDVELTTFSPEDSFIEKDFQDENNLNLERVHITEYHGLIPRKFLDVDLELDEDEELVDIVDPADELDEEDLVEAVVTIANRNTLLRVVRNANLMEDRPFLAYQHDTVPDSFWGRGLPEKAFNSQKALDSELRARIDSMALTIFPMMGVDSTKVPRGTNLTVAPGKSIFTVGDPNVALKPFTFGNVDPKSFNQASELERMVEKATGTFDGAGAAATQTANGPASGLSMMMSAFIKRNNKTMRNIGRDFIQPLVQKSAWRYMQFDPKAFPAAEVEFKIVSTMGIIARELEQQQLSSLLNTVPQTSPAYWMIIRSIFENSSISEREELIELVDQILQSTINPKPPTPDIDQQLKAQELKQKFAIEQGRVQVEFIRARAEVGRLRLQAEKASTETAKDTAKALLDIAKAEETSLGNQLAFYKATFDEFQFKNSQSINEVVDESINPGSEERSNQTV